ncbi:MAG: mitochondrial fission ELM1 family protein [Beijerinckiaceae bacterium]
MPTFHDSRLAEARSVVAGASCWALTDGKAGDEAQCLGVAERLGLAPELRRVRPRAPWVWAMPWGPVDPAEAPDKAGSPIRPPYPDIVIASGRRAVAYLKRIRQEAKGRTLTVFLKDPSTGADTAEAIWVPAHDRLRGPNVLATLTSPHRISPERLAAAAAVAPPWSAPPGRPVVGVLLGGDSQHHRFGEADCGALAEKLRGVAAGAFLAVTPSRRTPPALAESIRRLCAETGGWWWDGTGENPYLAILSHADHLVVTADSVNMLGEAAATGKPIHLFTPSGGHRKIAAFIAGLRDHGAVRPLTSTLESWSYDPLDATPDIAVAVAEAYAALRRGESWRMS